MQFSNYTYLIINLLVFAGPLFANIYFKVPGFKTFLVNFLKTFSSVGILLILWDSLVTSRGDWTFSSIYTTGVKLGNIPFEEALFFFTIPFASLALYELILIKIKDKRLIVDKIIFHFLSLSFIILSLIFSNYVYTTNIFLLVGLLFLVSTYFKKNNIFLTKNFYIFSLLSIIPFIIVNYILTSLPVVIYSTKAITNLRITTIPIEDFFYSFVMLSVYLAVYYTFKHNDEK